jgi:hypothetical protein
MSREDYVSQVVSEFGDNLGLADFEFDETRRASMSIDDMPVTFSYSASPVELLWIHMDLGEAPKDDPAALSGLLELGFLGWVSNRLTIGVDDAGERVIGQSMIPAISLDATTLRGHFEQMAESALLVRDRITRGDYNLENGSA